MLATSLEGQPGAVDASGRPLSPKVVQGSPVPVPGSLALAEGQSHSEPIPHARPHPERIARKYNYQYMPLEFVLNRILIIRNVLQMHFDILICLIKDTLK